MLHYPTRNQNLQKVEFYHINSECAAYFYKLRKYASDAVNGQIHAHYIIGGASYNDVKYGGKMVGIY